jgi:hypothetical protein
MRMIGRPGVQKPFDLGTRRVHWPPATGLRGRLLTGNLNPMPSDSPSRQSKPFAAASRA